KIEAVEELVEQGGLPSGLSDSECVHDSVLENIQLVHIDASNQLGSLCSDITNIERERSGQFALDCQVPVLHVRRAQPVIERPDCLNTVCHRNGFQRKADRCQRQSNIRQVQKVFRCEF